MFTVRIEDGGMTQRLTAMAARLEAIPQSVFQTIGEMFIESIHMNFDVEGRPIQWPPSKAALEEGRKTLTKTGALRNSGQIEEITPNSVTVTWGNGLPFDYGVVHQFGDSWTATPTEKQRKFMWAKWYQNKAATQYKGSALAKTWNIHLPARRFFNLQDDFLQSAGEVMRQYIINGQTEGITIL
jgi:phage gpG-like protein